MSRFYEMAESKTIARHSILVLDKCIKKPLDIREYVGNFQLRNSLLERDT